MSSTNKVPFGVMILINATNKALSDKNSIKSQILGNALFIAQDSFFPELINLNSSNNYRKLSDSQKKLLSNEIDKSKFPNYDSFTSISSFIISNWNNKTVFEKKENLKNSKNQNNTKIKQSHSKKTNTTSITPVVVYKSKKI